MKTISGLVKMKCKHKGMQHNIYISCITGWLYWNCILCNLITVLKTVQLMSWCWVHFLYFFLYYILSTYFLIKIMGLKPPLSLSRPSHGTCIVSVVSATRRRDAIWPRKLRRSSGVMLGVFSALFIIIQISVRQVESWWNVRRPYFAINSLIVGLSVSLTL